MIDSRITGVYISHLRHAKDWTQLELADKLNVTHQAVSRWEKGDSFPDIATLSNMATLFGVSVDDLLNGGPGAPRQPGKATTGDLLAELSKGHTETVARQVQNEEADIESLIDAAKLARPSQVDKVMHDLSGLHLTREQVVELCPFVSKEVLRDLVANLTPEDMDQGLLSDLAPFLDRETMDGLVRRALDGDVEAQYVVELAPFLSRETLDMLVERISEGKMDPEYLEHLAPFLSRASLTRLVEKVGEGGLSMEHVVSLAPFLPREALDGMVDRMAAGEIDPEHLRELAPFLSREALAKVLGMVADGKLDAHTIVELAPFLDKETLESLIRRKRA